MQYFFILLIAFIVGMEGILDEFQFHQPIIACSLIGLVTNHLYEGVYLGGLLQLIALGWVNVGASVAPDAALASIISSIFMIKGLDSPIDNHYVVVVSMLIAIPLSALGTTLTNIVRKNTIPLVHKMDEYAKKGKMINVDLYHLFGLTLQGLRIMIPALLLILIPSKLIVSFLNIFNSTLLEGLEIGANMACAVGFAMVMNVLYSKDIIPYLLLGFGLSCINSLTITVLAIICFALALINENHNNSDITKESNDPLGDILDDYK